MPAPVVAAVAGKLLAGKAAGAAAGKAAGAAAGKAATGKTAGKLAMKQMAAGAQRRDEGKPTFSDSARSAAQVGTDANKAIAGITPDISWPELIKAYGLAR